MKKINYVVMTTFAILTAFFIVSCDKNNDTDNDNNLNNGKAKVHVMLTDAPASYEQVNIEVLEVQLHSEADGWISVPMTSPGVYNLLDYSNGLDTLLGTCEIPEGTISQVRLILGDNNSIVVDGETFDLTIPSGSTSGLKINVHEELEAGVTYTFWLDFDAAQSVHQTGNGKYILKPVMRMYTEAVSGAIEGFVFPAEAQPFVTVYSSTDTLMALPDSTGYFKVSGLAAGAYNVEFASGLDPILYIPQTILDVQVVNGEISQLETITLILP
jgi:hypothetical protein